ncbi:MAG: hydroxymethylglutaryl-CoA lyase [Geothrix sp.]|uniref:hydroxymethylglutaryl-CoA lyase n=1 Tax=Geothrix sp. TaxID=1962974 RepID=UPI001822D04B|nr:hydroxymethylglutaryl-CoA lyase [Geothrix sp.]NWJ41326.1 hydroxymethylglutaryl-CoA lyase [Geothrix sp.]WIL20686.1 MAG: hydroxymethylglutaryl-CoA lyase [Geothrix sp.]
MTGAGQRLFIQEVGTRDGFQIEARFIPTADKIALIDTLSLCGLAKIEVTSFTSPKAIPALADADEVMRSLRRQPGVVYTALVPNLRGAERAIAAGTDELNLVMSASETHNLLNLRMTREQSLARLLEVVDLAQGAGVALNVSLSTSFGCPMEGVVPEDVVLGLAGRFLAAGVGGITLCDTTGMAHPGQVASLCRAFRTRFPGAGATLHLHNTRGMGLANALAGLGAGIDRFDASLGGLGGCPYAPGATGNICTEDLVHMLQAMGLALDVDLAGLLMAARTLPGMVGHEVPGQVLRAGRSLDLHPVPASLEEIRARALAQTQA